MIDNICTFLTKRIREKMPEIDNERAEIILYGLQNIVGEFPKIIIVLAISFLLGIFKETALVFLALLPYRCFSGGFHLKTHLGCIMGSSIFYCGIAFISKNIILNDITKYILIIATYIFGIIMISLYAPADTENVPILRKKDRRIKKILSYITFSIGLIIPIFIENEILINILIFGNFLQTVTITKLAYKLTNNKYGYEVYKTKTQNV